MNRVLSYTVGLVLAVALTLAAFGLVMTRAQSPAFIIAAVLVLAMVQLAVQLIFFLHLGQGENSRWNAALFCFTFFGILVIVLASVWIMYHLNYNMTPMQMNQYISNQSSF